MHRDIKPENLIFDEKGYLHVTDFGIAKYSTNNNSNETSGTPGYMAPEVISGQNHTGSVDYFAVGIITYELMMGKRPYLGKNRKEIREQMMIKQIYIDKDNIPLGWSILAADFINRLLLRKDSSRLGYYNELEVKNHPWLKNINFNDLINYKIKSPFIPRRNHDNYDKRYCREIEQIGINTNLRYEEYKNDERYCDLFEGFTYYNIDESKLISNDEINKTKIKIMRNNVNSNINDNNYIKKSKTINIDYAYNNKNNKNVSPKRNNNISLIKNRNLSLIKEQSLSSGRNDILTPRGNDILSPRGNEILSPRGNDVVFSGRNNNLSPIIKKNSLSYKNRSNYKNKTINYSNANESTNRKTPLIPKLYLKRNQSSLLLNDNTKISLKNEKDIYIMASPRNRGRISIYSNDNNIDNSFRRYANHSFVETNYSKGKILRRSYSSSNIHNSNYVNIFNLLVNNVNNNIINNNNENVNEKYLFHNYSKLSTPISYNKINTGRIPIDKTSISNYKNINNYNNSIINKNCHHHHRSFIENPKNYAFYCGDNDNYVLNYNYNNNLNNYNYYNNNINSNPYRYINKDLKNIFEDSLQEQNKNNIIKIYNNNNNIKRNHSNYSLRQKIPTGSIKKIIPITLKDNSILNKSNISNIDNSHKKQNIMNHNKIRSIEPINTSKISNNSIYIDKYVNNSSIKEKNKNRNSGKLKEINNIYNYKTIDCNNKVNNSQYQNSFLFEKSINKRNEVRYNHSYCHVNINSMNNNFYYNSNSKTNITINNPNNEINKKEKNVSYKKIPKPIPSDKKPLTKKKIEINKKVHNKNNSNPQINIINNNIINNNIINNNFINGSPINYNNNSNNNTNIFKENIKNSINNKYKSIIEINNKRNSNNNNKKEISFNNNQYGINNNKIINQNEKKDIISMKINEKTFCQYKYLENFDKYKKIKNNNNRNRHNYINKENSNLDSNNNIIKKKIREKYLTYDERDNKINKYK